MEVEGDGNPQINYEKIKSEFNLSETGAQDEKDEIINNNAKSLEEILCSMDIVTEIKELLISGSRKHNITKYKIMFIKQAINNKHTLKEIGAFMKTSQPAITNILTYYNVSEGSI